MRLLGGYIKTSNVIYLQKWHCNIMGAVQQERVDNLQQSLNDAKNWKNILMRIKDQYIENGRKIYIFTYHSIYIHYKYIHSC